MGSIFGSFHSATAALRQDQLALEATGENISNQNTAGYARKVVTWTGADTVTLSGLVSPETPTVSITAQRDGVLDDAVARATATSAAASTVKSAMDNLQAVFAIGSSGEEGSGVNAAMSAFFGAMQAVAADPTSSSARGSAVAAAQAVAASFQQTSSTLSQQTTDLNRTIESDVASVNQLSSSIAALNRSIAQAPPSSSDRDTLVGERTAQIASLSQLVGVQQTANSDGTVSLYTSNGAALVLGNHSDALGTATVSGSLRIQAQGTDVTGGLAGGTIGGALTVRDGALASASGGLDALATAFATAVNAANANGTTLAGAAGQAIFQIAGSDPHAASTIAVVAASGDDFAAAGSGEGAGGSRNANAMAALQSQRNASGGTFSETLSAMIGGIGLAASSANTAAGTADAALTQATTNQQAVSGVSLDTEAANLTQYQRSYQAEAKLLAVLNQIMTDSINLGTNTAVS